MAQRRSENDASTIASVGDGDMRDLDVVVPEHKVVRGHDPSISFRSAGSQQPSLDVHCSEGFVGRGGSPNRPRRLGSIAPTQHQTMRLGTIKQRSGT